MVIPLFRYVCNVIGAETDRKDDSERRFKLLGILRELWGAFPQKRRKYPTIRTRWDKEGDFESRFTGSSVPSYLFAIRLSNFTACV